MDLEQTSEYGLGREGEEYALERLRNAGLFVIRSYDYLQAQHKAPRLQGPGAQGYVLPDLDVSRDGVRAWVEVKTKADIGYYRNKRQWRHGIDAGNWQDYQAVSQRTGTRLFVIVLEKCRMLSAGRTELSDSFEQILIADAQTLQRSLIRMDNTAAARSAYGGEMVYFPRDVFAEWDATSGFLGPR